LDGPLVGLDLVEVERFRRALERHPRLEERLFTEAEISYCRSRGDPVLHLAARFAAGRGVPWTSVEVVNLPSGQPTLSVRDGKDYGFSRAHVSLTHLADHAIAVVVLER